MTGFRQVQSKAWSTTHNLLFFRCGYISLKRALFGGYIIRNMVRVCRRRVLPMPLPHRSPLININ